MTPTLIHGDMLAELPKLAANGVRFDSCVTDPPYHLASIVKRFGGKDAAPAKSDGPTGVYARASKGFMGKQWDGGDIAFRPETWALVGSVLKPGAHLVAFGAPKNGHRLTCAIEDAGFEIRDDITELLASDALARTFLASLNEEQVAAFVRLLEESPLGGFLGRLFWMFGSGFTKSKDVAAAIDLGMRRNGEGYAFRYAPPPELYEVTTFIRDARERAGKTNADIDALFGFNGMAGHWTTAGAQPAVPTMDQWPMLKVLLRLDDSKDELVAKLNAAKGSIDGTAFADREVTGEQVEWSDRSNYALTSRDGKRRDEPLTDLAAKWKGWGTALKPAYEPIVFARWPMDKGTIAANVVTHGTGAINVGACVIGDAKRCPANVIHDGSPEVMSAFPHTSSGKGAVKRATAAGYQANAYGKESRRAGTAMVGYGDTGSAARFFYSAKADEADRLRSKHPTVKPVDLMRWLVRLVTPHGGAVLDPFAGSGTTGMAAMAEGFDCTLIEREAEYAADIRRRIAHVSGADTPLFAAAD